jgi:hypothetical protein
MTELRARSHTAPSQDGSGERRRIVVLGMHRSGTSASTALINSLGAFVGSKEELTGAGAQNPRGFFERRDLRKVCDGLLHSTGADWWKITDFDVARVPQEFLAEIGTEIARILVDLDSHGTWVIKEPRLCLLLPVFLRYLKDPVTIFVVRNPLEVAKSLRHRNGFPRNVGLALWEVYCVTALRWSADLPRIVVRYGDLVENPAHTAERVYRELVGLGVVGLKFPDDVVIDPTLHRQSSSYDEFASVATDEQRKLWQAICDGSICAGYQPEVSGSARAVLEDFEEDQIARAELLEKTAGRTPLLEVELVKARSHLKTERQRIVKLEAEVSSLTALLHKVGIVPSKW